MAKEKIVIKNDALPIPMNGRFGVYLMKKMVSVSSMNTKTYGAK